MHRPAPACEQLRMIAPAAPGGGWDQTARVMQQVLQRAGLVRTAPVENIPGAAGTIGLARFIGAERGNADTLMVSGLIMLGGIVTHRAPVTLNDVTPIARLTGEYEVIAVPASVPPSLPRRLCRGAEASARSVVVGRRIGRRKRSDPRGSRRRSRWRTAHRVNYIAFSGGGESLAIIGGQVSVGVNGLAEFAPHIEAGTIRALAISSADPLPDWMCRRCGNKAWTSSSRTGVLGRATRGLRRRRSKTSRTADGPHGALAGVARRADALSLDRSILVRPRVQLLSRLNEERASKRSCAVQRGRDTRHPGERGSISAAGPRRSASTGCRRDRRISDKTIATPYPQNQNRTLAPAALVWCCWHCLERDSGGIRSVSSVSAALFWLTARAFDARHPVRDAVSDRPVSRWHTCCLPVFLI